MPLIPRHPDYVTGYHSLDRMIKGDNAKSQYVTVAMVAAETDVAEAYQASDKHLINDYTQSPVVAKVCSGVPILVNDTIGLLSRDVEAGADSVAILVKNERLKMLCDATKTYAEGETAYMIDPNTATHGGKITNDVSDAGTYYKVGIILGVKESNPTGFPTGSYVEVMFDGTLSEITVTP